ncbi:hypothetical protein CR513_43763, partial [Mucuna pruriens]
MFWKVEINIPLLDAIKQIPKYAKFLKELCVHKRRKMRGGVELGIVSALTKNEVADGSQQTLPKKCRDPGIFSVLCTIGEYTLASDMLNLGALINVMSTSIYKSMNFGDLEPIGMAIQLANRSIVQPLGVLEDVLVHVNELIFLVNFYVLDMEDETSGKGSTLILGRLFLRTTITKIDVHDRTLLMKFDENLGQFNIFEAMKKHPTEDPSLFGNNVIDELVVEYMQLEAGSAEFSNFAEDIDVIECLGSVIDESDYDELLEVQDLFDSEDDIAYLANLDLNSELIELIDQVCKYDEELEYLEHAKSKLYRSKNSYKHKWHKKEIGWRLSDLTGINPSICMHKILMEEEACPIRQQQRRLTLTILDVVVKEVTKLLAAGIIYPISNSQWVSPLQVVLKKSRMTIMKNQHDELVLMQI